MEESGPVEESGGPDEVGQLRGSLMVVGGFPVVGGTLSCSVSGDLEPTPSYTPRRTRTEGDGVSHSGEYDAGLGDGGPRGRSVDVSPVPAATSTDTRR